MPPSSKESLPSCRAFITYKNNKSDGKCHPTDYRKTPIKILLTHTYLEQFNDTHKNDGCDNYQENGAKNRSEKIAHTSLSNYVTYDKEVYSSSELDKEINHQSNNVVFLLVQLFRHQLSEDAQDFLSHHRIVLSSVHRGCTLERFLISRAEILVSCGISRNSDFRHVLLA